MRAIGYMLLASGFLWLAYDMAFSFNDDQAAIWTRYSVAKLPPGDTVSRPQVVKVMRELCLALKDRHRAIIVPAIMMLVGGICLGNPSFLRAQS